MTGRIEPGGQAVSGFYREGLKAGGRVELQASDGRRFGGMALVASVAVGQSVMMPGPRGPIALPPFKGFPLSETTTGRWVPAGSCVYQRSAERGPMTGRCALDSGETLVVGWD